jgi:hypothetical protein
MPTIRPLYQYGLSNQKADADEINAALSQSIGYNEKKVIEILANRTFEQRQMIAQMYSEIYSKVCRIS